jgi:sigma-B regulation protein RsbU (phosphoserine phosphatase)
MIKNFKIRTKILILLTSISLISGSILLYVSIETFKNDKIAYIFETNLNSTEQLNQQLAFESAFIKQNVNFYLDLYKKNQTLTKEAQDVIPENFLIEGLQIYNSENQQTKVQESIYKKNTKPLILNDSFFQFDQTNNPNQKIFFRDDFIVFVNMITDEQRKHYIVYYCKTTVLKDFFDSTSKRKSFLIYNDSQVVLHDKNSTPNFLSTNFPNLFESKKLLLNSSTSMINSNDGEVWLLSIAQTPLQNFKIVTLVSEKAALAAIDQVILKSILIFIILFLVVVIIGITSANYITNRLDRLYEHVQKVAEGNFNILTGITGQDEVSNLSRHFNNMTQEIKRLISETAQKARMENELKTAQLVQESLFPENDYKSNDIEICGNYQSASECGGDWWHYHETPDQIQIWIADATGHGASAALLTSAAKSSVTLLQDMQLGPIENIKMLNKSICGIAKEKLMMTCFHGVYNKKTKIFHYINASHEAPMVFKASEKNYTKTNIIFLDDSSGNRLGQSLTSEYSLHQMQLSAGDRIYFYTDGIPDVVNLSGTAFGERGHLKNVLQSFNSKQDLIKTKKLFKEALDNYRQNTDLVDDVTYFFVEVS